MHGEGGRLRWHGKGGRLRRQGVSFGVVGLSGTVLNTALVYVFYGLLRWPLPFAVVLASELAIFNNYRERFVTAILAVKTALFDITSRPSHRDGAIQGPTKDPPARSSPTL